MKKPFTPAGLQELLDTLYALSDDALQLEAATLAADLRTWLANNFILLPDQLSYLAAVDNRQISNAAADGQYFITNRLAIIMLKEEKPATAAKGDSEGKFFGLKRTKTSSYVPSIGFSEQEELTITIAYH